MALPGFASQRIAAAGTTLSVHTAGGGPAVLLLHGYPQTHLIWRHLGPALASRFTVIAPDLKGYGDSDAPPPAADAANYAKRAMAAELVALMSALGHHRYAVVGHDRGARVAYRMALDHPERVAKLAVLDIIPTGAMWASATRAFAINTFHWGFLAQGGALPERLIAANADFWLEFLCRKWARDYSRLADAMPEYRRCFRRPEVIAATCADYRAGSTLDDAHDQADVAAGRKIGCPILVLWSNTFVGQGKSADPRAIWRDYGVDVAGFQVDCGHFIPEEAPEVIAQPLERFLSAP